MKRGCLFTALLLGAVTWGAWEVLDPAWKNGAPVNGLALRKDSTGKLPAHVVPALYGPARLAIPVLGVRPDQLTDTFNQARGESLPIEPQSEPARQNGDQVSLLTQPSAPASMPRAEVRKHQALDIMAPLGTPVIAAAAGRVEKLHISRAGGNTVYIRSPNRRTIFYYAHLDRYAPSLREGAAVQPGTVLGTVGFTGNANPAGPHLHFAVLATTPERRWSDPATPINPYALLTGR